LGLSESDREAIARFEADVIKPSMDSLVILQFTAEWCGPCKQLSPVLDKLAADYASKKVKLARIDVD
jgi:putative thioredoxin